MRIVFRERERYPAEEEQEQTRSLSENADDISSTKVDNIAPSALKSNSNSNRP
jgi:hypothetical protein